MLHYDFSHQSVYIYCARYQVCYQWHFDYFPFCRIFIEQVLFTWNIAWNQYSFRDSFQTKLPANSSFLWQLHKISRNVKNKFLKVVFRLADLSFYERYVFQRHLLLLPENFSMKFQLHLLISWLLVLKLKLFKIIWNVGGMDKQKFIGLK